MTTTKQIAIRADNVFKMAAAISNAGFTKLAPALTPLAPAAFFAIATGTAVYERLEGWPVWARITLAAVVAFAAAAGLESAGYVSFGTAIRAFDKGLYAFSFLLPGAYLTIGIATVWLIEDPTNAVIGTGMFLLSACVYSARMLDGHVRKLEADRVKETAVAQQKEDDEEERLRQKEADAEARRQRLEDEEIAFQRQLKADAAARRFELKKLEKTEAIQNHASTAGTMPALVQTNANGRLHSADNAGVSGTEEFPCDNEDENGKCSFVATSIQGLNAHKGRWCKHRRSENKNGTVVETAV